MSRPKISLLAISGSLRSASANTAVLQAMSDLAPDGVEIAFYPAMCDLPHFNADLDGDHPPAIVQELRAAVGRADAVLISSPEYAHGVPGSLKNLLDWLVASLEFPGKPVGVINASPRSVHADAALKEILKTMSANLVPGASIAVALPSRSMDRTAIAANPELAHALTGAIDALVSYTQNNAG